MEALIYTGLIHQGEYGDNSDTTFIGDTGPISYILEEEIAGKNVSVRYWISDTPKEKQQLQEDFLISISGGVIAEYSSAYSEITGYLWTDEALKVGGHDLLNELIDNVGKYIYIEIDVHE